MKPLHDWVLLRPEERPGGTVGGLFLPDNNSLIYGTVLEAGPGSVKDGVLRPMSVAVGDSIVAHSYERESIVLDNEVFLLVRDADIIGKFTKENK